MVKTYDPLVWIFNQGFLGKSLLHIIIQSIDTIYHLSIIPIMSLVTIVVFVYLKKTEVFELNICIACYNH